jgi:hypothetical protein
MAVFEARYVTAHIYSVSNTRARGWRSGPGGWARVPHCSCGWNNPAKFKGDRFWWTSPHGSMFPDHFANDEIAYKVWVEEHMFAEPPDAGQLLLAAV